MRRAATLLLAALLLVHAAGVARADDKAESLIQKAIDLRRNGDDQSAYPLFVEAYDLSHTPRAAGQRGLCEQALGRWADAETHMTEALKAPADPWVKKNRGVLEQSLSVIKTHIARIDVVGEPAGAEVLVNGTVSGRLPLSAPVRVAAGEIEIELRAPGYARASKSVRVDDGQYQRVVLRAEAEKPAMPPPVATTPSPGPSPSVAAPADAPSAGTTTAPVTVSTTAPVTVVGQAAPPSGGPGGVRGAAKWIAWGAAAASAGVGIFGTMRQLGAGNDFDKSCGLDSMGVPRPAAGAPSNVDCAGLKSKVDSGFTIELVGFIGAAVLTGAGVALWLTEPEGGRAEATAPRTSLACAPGLRRDGGPWLGCSLRF